MYVVFYYESITLERKNILKKGAIQMARKEKVRGKEVVTVSRNQELIDDKDTKTVFFLKNLAIHNMGGDNIHVIINGGDEIMIRGNEVMTCGEIKVYSLVVVETGSNIRYMGIEG